MRIDYSPPKQSYVSGQSKPRPRKEPVGLFTGMIVITGLIAFAAGFGSGWFLSERSTKKAFQAAAEQSSLESTPKQTTAAPPTQPQPAPSSSAQQASQPAAAPPQTAAATSATPAPQLSFYKTLPGGQKSALLGSGINTREEGEKQPLQAAVPSNLAKRQQAASAAPKAPSERHATADKPAPEKPVSSERPAAADRPAATAKPRTGFTVQVASYNLKSEAEAMKSKLAGKGYNVIISESNQGDKGTWYRVRVGRKLEQEAARELAGKIGKGAIATPE